jgi:hypothetical protein
MISVIDISLKNLVKEGYKNLYVQCIWQPVLILSSLLKDRCYGV